MRSRPRSATWPSQPRRAVGALTALALALGSSAVAAGASTTARVSSAKGGGDLVFGLEADTNNYCLSSAQLAISGIQVVAAVYDTLTVPNSQGESTPYLAKSVEPNADYTEWTITLREGVTFHDGTPLDADAVKQNLDSWRGAPGAVNVGPLLPLAFKAWTDVQIVDPLTVKVATAVPVVDFPNGLSGSGRLGIMAPAQLNAGADCATKMIGTGPFALDEYRQNESTTVVKNKDYWQKGFPKADSIKFVPVVEGPARVNQLQGGQLDLMHTSGAIQTDALRSLGDQVKVFTEKPGFREVRYYVLLADKPPFDNPDARKAVALALNRSEINEIRNLGLFDDANSLMDRKAPGYLKNAGYPKHNQKEAKKLAAKVKAETGSFDVLLGAAQDEQSSAEVQLVKQQLDDVGINGIITQFDQATLINKALSRDIDVLFWRNLHGGYSKTNDTDTYPWFSNVDGANFLNFSGFEDPKVQAFLDQGRSEPDPAKAKEIYEDFNRAMAEGLYALPVWFVNWTIGYANDVKLTFPKLPDGNGKPLFVFGRVPVLGLEKR